MNFMMGFSISEKKKSHWDFDSDRTETVNLLVYLPLVTTTEGSTDSLKIFFHSINMRCAPIYLHL